MKKIRGVIVYPTQIEEVVHRFPEVAEYLIRIWRRGHLDEITIQIDLGKDVPAAAVDQLSERLRRELRRMIGIRVDVEPAPPNSLPRWDHKARRVRDERSSDCPGYAGRGAACRQEHCQAPPG